MFLAGMVTYCATKLTARGCSKVAHSRKKQLFCCSLHFWQKCANCPTKVKVSKPRLLCNFTAEPAYCSQTASGRGIWILFERNFINCPVKHCQIWRQGQCKHEMPLRFLRSDRKLGIARNAKKVVKTKKVARHTRSCQKVAEQLVESLNSLVW